MTSLFTSTAEEAFYEGDYIKSVAASLLAIRDELFEINETLKES